MTTSPRSPQPDEPTQPDPAAALDTDLALYVLGALDDTELRTVETVLASDAASAAVEARLRRAAGTLGAAADGIDLAPPLDLRDRVLAAARAERSPAPDAARSADAAELHRIEGEALVGLLRSLTPADWNAPVDPPEFAGWTVGDVVAHLATIQAYLAQRLGVAHPEAAEQQLVNEDRTHAAIARHRDLSPAAAIDELESFLAAVDDDVAQSGHPAVRRIVWWGRASTVDRILVVRSFELWIHAADIARAVGRPEPVPPAPALRTMSDLATALTPIMGAVAGTLAPDVGDQWVRFTLTGAGGGTHDVALAAGGVVPPAGEPTTTLTLDVVDYCRAVADRIGPDGVTYEHAGDATLAAAVIASLPALATL